MEMDSVIAPVLQVKFHFMGCLVKTNSLVSGNRSLLSSKLIVLLLLQNNHLQRDILPNIFLPVFSWTSAKFLQCIKKMKQKFLESSQTPVAKSYFSKVAGFYRSSHRKCFVKKVFLEIPQNSQENICAKDSILIKLQA